jgi:hypothetical protein
MTAEGAAVPPVPGDTAGVSPRKQLLTGCCRKHGGTGGSSNAPCTWFHRVIISGNLGFPLKVVAHWGWLALAVLLSALLAVHACNLPCKVRCLSVMWRHLEHQQVLTWQVSPCTGLLAPLCCCMACGLSVAVAG